MRYNSNTNYSIASLINHLSNELDEALSNKDNYEQHIYRLREFIGEIDAKLEMIRKGESIDVQADIVEVHDFICNGKPDLPYNLRRGDR